jgi:uncharacterized protein YndB with AHSA1/START domain
MRIAGFFAAGALIAAPAAAEVKSATDTEFELVITETVKAPPETLWTTLTAPSRWWNKDHSWSGDAANFALDPKAGGCFCEALPKGGSVEHARVIFAQPGAMLRLSGGLGPLQSFPVTGVLTFTLKPAPGGASALEVRYAVAGRIGMPGGTAQIAPLVDKVLTQQVSGLKRAAETGPK